MKEGNSRLKVQSSTSINYDSRVLKKPPNPSNGSVRARQSHKTLSVTEPVLKLGPSDHERKEQVVKQVKEHLRSGKLPPKPLITPVTQGDAVVRQYLVNSPIDDPDENEHRAPLKLNHEITHTTVDKSKVSSKRNG